MATVARLLRRELRSSRVPCLDSPVPRGERKEVRVGAEGGEEVADGCDGGRHGRRAAGGRV
jgi:hypothetical protein